MTIKYEFKAGCSCPLKSHSIILEFESESDLESYEEDQERFALILICVNLYFPEKDGCFFNNVLETQEIETDKYTYSFAKHKEWDGNDDDDEENNIFSFLSQTNKNLEDATTIDDEKREKALDYLNNLCSYRIIDDINRDIVVQFKNNDIYNKHFENNFKDVLTKFNKYFLEEYDIKHTEDMIFKTEKIDMSEIPHLFIAE